MDTNCKPINGFGREKNTGKVIAAHIAYATERFHRPDRVQLSEINLAFLVTYWPRIWETMKTQFIVP